MSVKRKIKLNFEVLNPEWDEIEKWHGNIDMTGTINKLQGWNGNNVSSKVVVLDISKE